MPDLDVLPRCGREMPATCPECHKAINATQHFCQSRSTSELLNVMMLKYVGGDRGERFDELTALITPPPPKSMSLKFGGIARDVASRWQPLRGSQ